MGLAQDRLGWVAALLPEELIGRGLGESVLSEEPLWPQPVVLLYRAKHLSAGHVIPGPHAVPFRGSFPPAPGAQGDCPGPSAHRQICYPPRDPGSPWGTRPAGDRMRNVDTTQSEKVRTGRGFFAALDQSGGSTPKALAEYGIERDRYSSDAEMFDLVHAMRTRVLTSPAFDGSRILAAILFEQTMDREVNGVPTARYLWNEKSVVPFLKVDKGLAAEQDGVQLMKPIDTLDDLLERALRHQIFGTKMRSVIHDADEAGISAIVDQQFGYASRILAAGLVPIIEPEVSISSPHKERAETLLRDAIAKHVQTLPEGTTVMLKITIPARP